MTLSTPEGKLRMDTAGAGSAVAVIDDDGAVRRAVAELLNGRGVSVSTFAGAAEFLGAEFDPSLFCILLDVRLPGMNGLDLQDHLNQSGWKVPIVFMTGDADVSMSVRAMKGGAIDFIQKPFREQDLLDAVGRAQANHRHRSEIARLVEAIRNRVGSLTVREKEVLEGVCRGLLNKQIAAELGISEITVKVHRGHVMKKMKARTAAELVKHASLHAFMDTQIADIGPHLSGILIRGGLPRQPHRRSELDPVNCSPDIHEGMVSWGLQWL